MYLYVNMLKTCTIIYRNFRFIFRNVYRENTLILNAVLLISVLLPFYCRQPQQIIDTPVEFPQSNSVFLTESSKIDSLMRLVSDSIFPVPDYLTRNVFFWIKMYGQLSEIEGVLHDKLYPLVIYAIVSERDFNSSEEMDNYLELTKSYIKNSLHIIKTLPEENWSSYEKQIAYLMTHYAQPGAIDEAHERIRFQQGRREHFTISLQRSQYYIDTISSILRQYGIPERLAYLPHVESSFNQFIRSKAGALGMWQIMPSVAKSYNLKINRIIDGRRDPIVSTHIAARILQKNYRQLTSWPLAVTAYNCGVYGMKKAVSKTESHDIGVIAKTYQEGSFGFASSNFYSCFLATSYLAHCMKAADKGGAYKINKFYYWKLPVQTVILQKSLTPSAISEKYGLNQKLFQMLNPQFRHEVFMLQSKIPSSSMIIVPNVKNNALLNAVEEQSNVMLETMEDSVDAEYVY